MKRSMTPLFIATSLLLLVTIRAHADGAVRETADIVGQSAAGPVVSAGGASLIRTANGIKVAVKLPTPAPFSYNYPASGAFQPTVIMGAPEVFTGWVFVFNYPDLCSDPCDSNDLGLSAPALGGAYNFGGHPLSGGTLRMAGHVSVGETPFGATHAPLENPLGAEIHLAIAPHGTLQPELMPSQINTPIGDPTLWWLAFFKQ
jgi:hypothetical protein